MGKLRRKNDAANKGKKAGQRPADRSVAKETSSLKPSPDSPNATLQQGPTDSLLKDATKSGENLLGQSTEDPQEVPRGPADSAMLTSPGTPSNKNGTVDLDSDQAQQEVEMGEWDSMTPDEKMSMLREVAFQALDMIGELRGDHEDLLGCMGAAHTPDDEKSKEMERKVTHLISEGETTVAKQALVKAVKNMFARERAYKRFEEMNTTQHEELRAKNISLLEENESLKQKLDKLTEVLLAVGGKKAKQLLSE
jgi:hypothetical protein